MKLCLVGLLLVFTLYNIFEEFEYVIFTAHISVRFPHYIYVLHFRVTYLFY